jgi:uncharacterized protein (TIGR03067 family)
MLPRMLMVCLGLLLLTSLQADDKDAAKMELEKFQGEWKLVSNEDITIKFEEDKYTFSAGPQSEKGIVKLNPSKKPAHLDFDITEGDDKGKNQVGVYEWKNDTTLRISLAIPGEKERPEKIGEGEVQFEFEKVKK